MDTIKINLFAVAKEKPDIQLYIMSGINAKGIEQHYFTKKHVALEIIAEQIVNCINHTEWAIEIQFPESWLITNSRQSILYESVCDNDKRRLWELVRKLKRK